MSQFLGNIDHDHKIIISMKVEYLKFYSNDWDPAGLDN